MDHLPFSNDVTSFFILLIISEVIRRSYKDRPLELASGDIIMAIGVFTVSALQQLPFASIFIENVIILELLVVWVQLAILFTIQFKKGNLQESFQDINKVLAIGTWVAGTAILDVLVLQQFPSWHLAIWTLTFLAISIWAAYLWLLLGNRRNILGSDKAHTGTLLLSTVSTQAIVILINDIAPNTIPNFVNLNMMALGILFYFIGLLIILIGLFSRKIWQTLMEWSNTNSIIHGAASITGIAGLCTDAYNRRFIVFTWVMSSCLFVLVEGISLIRLFYRIYYLGFIKGLCEYDVSQWARNFTYGMYYYFSFSIYNNLSISNPVINPIVLYGQYLVLAMLLIEIFIFFRDRLRC